MDPSDDEIARARLRGKAANASEPPAKAVSFDPSSQAIVVKLATDVTISFGLDHVPELRVTSQAKAAAARANGAKGGRPRKTGK